ncbi:MAG: glutamate racemase [Cytophagales bacterium]|nr:glutamate racemase [Cytophagales bacterium]MDW8383424.1 glutamate racemase [Flammeovirgaceae bacterium]
MNHLPKNPIGIFDSGIGGLTVAHAVSELLPNENMIYFGDTAHLPYGEKSIAAIQAYTVKICDFLLSKKCKVILIACNSASAAGFELAKEYVASRAKVLNVIDPVVEYVSQKYSYKRVGLIGTRATVNSRAYPQKLSLLNPTITLQSLATPLLASMIEEGFFNNSVSKAALEAYLSNPVLKGIEALILGCTHYPLIKKEIEAFYKGKVEVIDGSYKVAEALKNYLTENRLLKTTLGSRKKFYVSDFTESFEASTKIFFGRKVHLNFYRLWE